MFYSQFILAKKGPLGTIWIAAHLERKLRKNQVADTDIGVSVDSILFPDVPIALRLSSHLLLGVVRIYSRKVNYLFDDCSEALLKIKQAFRSAAVDLPPEESTAPYHSITLPETFDLDDFELPDSDIFQGNYVDHHVSSREQITLQDTMEGVVYSTSQFGLDERFGDGDTSGLDLDEELFLNKVADVGQAGVISSSAAGLESSAPPLIPLKQDENHQAMIVSMAATHNVNQHDGPDGDDDVIEYAQAPCTPGLMEEPNLSNVQETSAFDDHLESENHNTSEFSVKENLENASSKSDSHHQGNKHVVNWPLPNDINNPEPVPRVPTGNNGYRSDDPQSSQLKPQEQSLVTSMTIEQISTDNPDPASLPPSSSLAFQVGTISPVPELSTVDKIHEDVVKTHVDMSSLISAQLVPEGESENNQELPKIQVPINVEIRGDLEKSFPPSIALESKAQSDDRPDHEKLETQIYQESIGPENVDSIHYNHEKLETRVYLQSVDDENRDFIHDKHEKFETQVYQQSIDNENMNSIHDNHEKMESRIYQQLINPGTMDSIHDNHGKLEKSIDGDNMNSVQDDSEKLETRAYQQSIDLETMNPIHDNHEKEESQAYQQSIDRENMENRFYQQSIDHGNMEARVYHQSKDHENINRIRDNPRILETRVYQQSMTRESMDSTHDNHVLQSCTTRLNQPDASIRECGNSAVPNFLSQVAGMCLNETSGTREASPAFGASTAVQGEGIHTTRGWEQVFGQNQMPERVSFQDVQENSIRSTKDQVENVSGYGRLENLNSSTGPEFPAPEQLLIARRGLADVPQRALSAPQGISDVPEKLFFAPEGLANVPEKLPAPEKLFAPQGHANVPEKLLFAPQGHANVPEKYPTPEKLFVPQGHSNVPEKLLFGPQGHANVPVKFPAPEKFFAPQGNANVTEKLLFAPQGHANVPENFRAPEKLFAPQEHANVPEKLLFGPQGHTNVPPEKLFAPQGHANVPEKLVFAPQGHANVPEKFPAPENLFGPQGHSNVPEKLVFGPQGHANVPEKFPAPEKFFVPQGHANVPEKLVFAPQRHANVPPEKLFAPQGHANVPEKLPAPEKFMFAPQGVANVPNNFVMDFTPKRGVVLDEGYGGLSQNISGKKRMFTESAPTAESLNSFQSFAVHTQGTIDSIRNDNDLLSSILVGKRSSALKVKPTPPAIRSMKRPRSTPRTNASKRKVLVDDSMVLHGDTIRLQLTSTEDIRRLRKKAPCTRPEILMIRNQFCGDEIFNESILSGVSRELASLHNQTYDLGRTKVSQSNVNDASYEAAPPRKSVSQNDPSETRVSQNDASVETAMDPELTLQHDPSETRVSQNDASFATPMNQTLMSQNDPNKTRVSQNDASFATPMNPALMSQNDPNETRLSQNDASFATPMNPALMSQNDPNETRVSQNDASFATPMNPALMSQNDPNETRVSQNDASFATPMNPALMSQNDPNETRVSQNDSSFATPVNPTLMSQSDRSETRVSQNDASFATPMNPALISQNDRSETRVSQYEASFEVATLPTVISQNNLSESRMSQNDASVDNATDPKLISQNDTSQARVPQHDDSFGTAVDPKLYSPKDGNFTSLKEASDMDVSIGPNVTKETVIEGSSDPMAVRDNGERQFVDIPVEIEKRQCEEDHTVNSEIHATQVQIENLTNALAEPSSSSQIELFQGEISEMENNGNNISDSDAINPDVTFGVESSYTTDPVSYTKPIETEAVSLQINEPDVVLDPNSVKGLDDANETAENKDGEKELAAVEMEVVAKDELSEKTERGVSVEIGAENIVNPSVTFFPETVVTADQVMGDIAKNEQGGLVNVDDIFDAIEENNANNESVSHGMSGVGDSSFQAAHVKFDLGNVSLDDGENQGQQETYQLSTMEPETDAIDLNDNDSNDSPVGHDTGFLNADDDDDDEVAEADDDYVPGAGETHYLENSGWSSRTRAVANYLQTLFDKEPDRGKKVVPINDLLAGKTRKEASRMFFEALVLKTKDYIHVEQQTAFDNINILPRVKLMKSSF